MSLLRRLNERTNAGINQPSGPYKKEVKISKTPELINHLHQHVIAELKKHADLSEEEQISMIERESLDYLNKQHERILSLDEKKELIEAITNELIGFGPITPLLNDPEVSEIMVNGPYQIYIEKKGKLKDTQLFFRDDDHVLQVIEKIVSPLGRRINETSPMVDARLPDGSRVNAIIPPLSLVGPVMTIRKFPSKRLEMKDFIRLGTLTEVMAKFLDGCVKARLNILVSGGTGSGKTTLLNVLSSFIPNDDRIVTIEDAAELQLMQDHVIPLETRPPNIEGKGSISIRDLVRNSLRMRPDRIIIGEVRSAEALDMLQAMNTGHDGSLATAHANSPRDMLSRLETMVLMAGMDLPVKAIREQIASAIDIIIQQTRLKDGSRKITHITEVIGMEGETIILQDLFIYKQTGLSNDGKLEGKHTSTGLRPYVSESLEHYGIHMPAEWFTEV
ncbi:CpaF family protein [Bacillus massilinigeriensis]|uniref:CpaF family protein n=1 Tax=Bacillus massilionigeriensis TaxID=1805475 RepID=UPI00096AF086|nr:CpaF family protein [Bacillus massilionigeriensis]